MKNCTLFLLLIVFFACENDNSNNPAKETDTTHQVFAGVVDTLMVSNSLSPEFQINYTWDDCGYGFGKDSVDLFNNGIYDFRIRATFLDYEAFMICCGEADCWPSGLTYDFTSLNTIRIATYQDQYYEDTYFTYADTLSHGYRLDTIKQWNSYAKLWFNDVPYPHTGAWFFIESDRYLAFRIGDSSNYKYGWIKIGTNTDHNLIFKEYAVEK